MTKIVMNEAEGKEFIRILEIITKVLGTWVCKIDKGVISHGVGNNLYLHIDLKSLFGVESEGSDQQMQTKTPDLCFLLNKTIVKDLKSCVGYGPISITADDSDHFIVQGDHTFCQLTQVCSNNTVFRPVPTFNKSNYLGQEVTMNKDQLADIKKYLNSCKRTQGNLLIYGDDNQLEQYQPFQKAPYTFDKNGWAKIKGQQPKLSLYSRNFLSIVGNHQVTIRPALKNKVYWLETTSMFSLGLNISVFEILN